MIVDASVVVAGVLADQRHDEWALEVLLRGRLAAPHLMPVEVTQKLRRDVIRGSVTARDADVAMDDLARLPIDLYPFEPVAQRVWELRDTVSAYDGVVRRPGRGPRRTSRHARHATGEGDRSAVCVSRPRCRRRCLALFSSDEGGHVGVNNKQRRAAKRRRNARRSGVRPPATLVRQGVNGRDPPGIPSAMPSWSPTRLCGPPFTGWPAARAMRPMPCVSPRVSNDG